MTRMITMFRCAPLRSDMTRTGCGQRWERFNGKGDAPPRGGKRPTDPHCTGCDIGRAHADGDRPERWPSGELIALHDREAPSPPTPPPVAAPEPAPSAFRDVAPSNPAGFLGTGATGPRGTSGPRGRPPRGASQYDTIFIHEGQAKTARQWAKEMGISEHTITQRIRNGMSLREACTTPNKRHASARRAVDVPPVEHAPAPDAPLSPAAEPPHPMPTPATEPPAAPNVDAAPTHSDPDATPRPPSHAIPPPANPWVELFRPPAMTPEAVLRAAGFDIVTQGQVPAGWCIIVRNR